MTKPTLRILGTRGVPATHGGFETFAEHLALYLVKRGWHVIVYCQDEGDGPVFDDTWCGIERIHFPVRQQGPAGTIVFDWHTTRHAAQCNDLCLTLGYNTAVFCSLLRLKGVPNVINMDGIEWSRAKWGPIAKSWFWMNDWAGCWLGNHLVADHPEIKVHLSSRANPSKITTIAYGADPVLNAPTDALTARGLESGKFMTVIARPEPENSLLEIVEGFSRKPRGMKLVVLGNYNVEKNPFHKAVKQAAGPEVVFVGAIYDKAVVQALRWHSAAYVHGHQVGGTNPSLVEALGAGNAVIAHDNRFNRWVTGAGAVYFDSADTFSQQLDDVLSMPGKLDAMRAASRKRFEESFTWDTILSQYEELLTQWLPDRQVSSQPSRRPSQDTRQLKR